MEVLTSPVSSLFFPSSHRETLNLPKSPLSSSYANLSSSKPNPPFSLSSSSSSKPLSLLSASSTLPPLPTTLTGRTHHRAATGYAAALIDFSRHDGLALASVARDVRRLAAFISSAITDSSMVDEERAEAVWAMVASGGFYRRLVALVRMVVAKKRGVEEVADVLEEFGRIWREMTLVAVEGVDVVVVSEKKMGIEWLAKVAGEVQRACGAVQVNMKNFFRRRSPRGVVATNPLELSVTFIIHM